MLTPRNEANICVLKIYMDRLVVLELASVTLIGVGKKHVYLPLNVLGKYIPFIEEKGKIFRADISVTSLVVFVVLSRFEKSIKIQIFRDVIHLTTRNL